MNFELVNDRDVCKALWKQFSPHSTLWDEWEPSIASYISEKYRIEFFVLKEENNIIGIVPLHYNNESKRWDLFGSTYSEERTLWVPDTTIPYVFDNLPRPCRLLDLNGAYTDKIIELHPEYKQFLIEDDYKFYVDLKKISYDLETYLDRMSKKHRRNLLYDLKKTEERNYIIEWTDKADIKFATHFNTQRFGSESDYADEQFVEEIKQFFSSIQKQGIVHTVQVKQDDKIVGIEIAAYYKNNYYVLNGGYDLTHKNLGKRIIMEHIKHAIALGADTIDFLVGDTGWKELWNFEKIKVCTFKFDE